MGVKGAALVRSGIRRGASAIAVAALCALVVLATAVAAHCSQPDALVALRSAYAAYAAAVLLIALVAGGVWLSACVTLRSSAERVVVLVMLVVVAYVLGYAALQTGVCAG